jgi:hypothetical protein
MYQKVIALVATGFLITAFQNCQKAAMSASGESANSKLSGDLIPVTGEDPGDASGVIVQPPGTGSDQVVDNGSAPGPIVDNPGSSPDPIVSDNGTAPGNSGGAPGHNKDDGSVDQGDGNVCILDGPGKSVKLGISDTGVMGGQHPIPGVLCMSANACLNIASQIFKVKGPEFRGYCKLPHGNPHVTHITDAQLQAKVTALKANP